MHNASQLPPEKLILPILGTPPPPDFSKTSILHFFKKIQNSQTHSSNELGGAGHYDQERCNTNKKTE